MADAVALLIVGVLGVLVGTLVIAISILRQRGLLVTRPRAELPDEAASEPLTMNVVALLCLSPVLFFLALLAVRIGALPRPGLAVGMGLGLCALVGALLIGRG